MPTNQPQHILSKVSTVITITYPSYIYHLLTQLLLHHYSNNKILHLLFRPPLLISPSFHPHHPSTLPSPSHLLQTTHINHLFLSSLQTSPPFHSDNLNYTSQPAPICACQASHHTAVYTCMLQDAGLHLPFYGRQMPPTQHEDFWSYTLYRKHTLAYHKPLFTDLSWSLGRNLYHNVEKCGLIPVKKGRNSTS